MGGFLSQLGHAFGQSGQGSSMFSNWTQPTGSGLASYASGGGLVQPQQAAFMQSQQQAQPAGPSGLYALLQMIGALNNGAR